jgi:hypothetical protein
VNGKPYKIFERSPITFLPAYLLVDRDHTEAVEDAEADGIVVLKYVVQKDTYQISVGSIECAIHCTDIESHGAWLMRTRAISSISSDQCFLLLQHGFARLGSQAHLIPPADSATRVRTNPAMNCFRRIRLRLPSRNTGSAFVVTSDRSRKVLMPACVTASL